MKLKAILGALLAVLSLVALYLWETKYEDNFMMMPVLVASSDIEAGQEISPSSFKEIRITPDSKLEAVYEPDDAALLVGKLANCSIKKNQQLLPEYFERKEDAAKDGYTFFSIPSSWVYSRSSHIGRRSFIEIYAMPDRLLLGTFRVEDDTDSGVEIVARLIDYFKIYDAVTLEGNKLLFVEASNE